MHAVDEAPVIQVYPSPHSMELQYVVSAVQQYSTIGGDEDGLFIPKMGKVLKVLKGSGCERIQFRLRLISPAQRPRDVTECDRHDP